MGIKIASTPVQTPPVKGNEQNQTGLQTLQNYDIMLRKTPERSVCIC